MMQNLPFSHISLRPNNCLGVSSYWQLDITLGHDRPLKFFALQIFNDGPPENDQIIQELNERMTATIRYQHHLLEDNRISVTNEDFFEQCLQKMNTEISNFLRETTTKLPVHTWAILIGMLVEDKRSKRLQFFTSRFGDITGWLLNNAQLKTKKLITIFDTPDQVSSFNAQKFFNNILSSSLPKNDQLFFCSPNLLNYVSLSDIKHVLSTLSVNSALKHLENQVKFHSNETVIAAMTLKLSPYPVVDSVLQTTKDATARSSMSTLIQTQNETEKILGTSLGLNFKKLKNLGKNIVHRFYSLTNPNQSELIPSRSGKKSSPYLLPMIQTSFAVTGIILKNLLKPVKRLFYIKTKANKRKGALELLSTNQTVTRVNIWKKQLFKLLKPFQKVFSKNRLSHQLKNPIPYLSLIALIVIILCISIINNYYKKNAQAIASAQNTLTVVGDNITQIDAYLIVGREDDAMNLVKSSEELLVSLKNIEETQIDADKFSTDLEQRKRRLRKEILIEQPKKIVSQLQNTFGDPAQGFYLQDEKIFVLGTTPRKLIQVNLSNNSTQIIDIKTDVTNWKNIIPLENSQFLLTDNNSLTTVDYKTMTSKSTALNIQNELRSVSLFNNRLYALSEKQLFRSNRTPSYGVLTNWLVDDVDLSSATDITIDGSIYVLFPNNVIRLIKGKITKPPMTLTNIDPPLGNAKQIGQHLVTENLFIMEPQRLLRFTTKGQFISQYKTNENLTYKDMIVDETRNCVYLLTDDEIIKIAL